MRTLCSYRSFQYNGAFARLRRFTMRTILLLTTMLLVSGCASMLLGNIPSGESAQTTRTSTLSAADSALSSEIRRKLGEYEGLSQNALGIRTRAGRVTLTGTVGSYKLRDRAISIARDTDGVSAVDSRVIVNTNQ